MSTQSSMLWIEARSPEQAVSEAVAAKDGPAIFKAGGVDVMDLLKEGLIAPGRLINLRRSTGKDAQSMTEVVKIPGSGERPSTLRIGSLLTLSQLGSDKTIETYAPALAKAAQGAATPQIRNLATLAGNLLQRPRCWYFRSSMHLCRKKGGEVCFAQEGENEFHAIFDNALCAMVHPSSLATALLALCATCVVLGKEGKERRFPIDELFVSPRTSGGDLSKEHRLASYEVLQAVEIPLGQRSSYLKVKHKQSFDWPLVEVAIGIPKDPQEVRVVLGAVAPVPHRAKGAEAALRALIMHPLKDAGLSKVTDMALQGARPLLQNKYKVELVRALLPQALQMALSSEVHP